MKVWIYYVKININPSDWKYLNKGDSMKEGNLMPITIEIQERSDCPTVEEFKTAKVIRITDQFGEHYMLTWRFTKRSPFFNLEITGGMFGDQPEISCQGYDLNTVNNVPEVILSLASGEKKVRILLGKKSRQTEPCYVQISISKVELLTE